MVSFGTALWTWISSDSGERAKSRGHDRKHFGGIVVGLGRINFCFIRSPQAKRTNFNHLQGRSGRLARRPLSLHLSTASGRPSSANLSLDLKLVAESPELVEAHLRARHSSPEVIAMVSELGALSARRAGLIQTGDSARAERKRLSAEIGALLKAGGDASALKAQVTSRVDRVFVPLGVPSETRCPPKGSISSTHRDGSNLLRFIES